MEPNFPDSENSKQEAKIELEIPNVMLLSIQTGGNPALVDKGKLLVIKTKSDSQKISTHLSLNKFSYTINREIPVYTNELDLCSFAGKKIYLSSPDSLDLLVITEDLTESEKKLFLSAILSATSLVVPENERDQLTQGRFQEDLLIKIRFEPKKPPKSKIEIEIENEDRYLREKGSKAIGQVLSLGGDLIKEGIANTGKQAGYGIEKTSWAIKKIVKKNEEEEEISENTLRRCSTVSDKTDIVKKVANNGLHKVIEKGKKQGIEATEKLGEQKCDLEKDNQVLKQTEIWNHSRNIGKGALHVVGGVLHGFDEAIGHIFGSSSRLITDVTEHKLGKKAGDAVKNGLKVATDINEMIALPLCIAKEQLYTSTKMDMTIIDKDSDKENQRENENLDENILDFRNRKNKGANIVDVGKFNSMDVMTENGEGVKIKGKNKKEKWARVNQKTSSKWVRLNQHSGSGIGTEQKFEEVPMEVLDGEMDQKNDGFVVLD